MSKIKGIKYFGPILDSSGYGKASRAYVLALYRLGIPICIQPISFDQDHPDLGEDQKIIEKLAKNPVDYNVKVLHSTPEFWRENVEEGVHNIGYTIWETTKLHPDWPSHINDNVEGVLVGSDWNIDVFENSGVAVPVKSVPHTIPVDDSETAIDFDVSGVDPEAFKFYSIFQWVERKNPLAAIKAYWYAFQNDENVAYIIKTHRSNFSEEERDLIRTTIQRLKSVTVLDKYPPIYLVTDLLSEDEMRGLHQWGDCLVSMDRGEGFGLCPFQAGAYGKPIIITGFGGAMEYAKEDNSYICDYALEPVFGMPWSPWYRADQLWAYPSIYHGSQLMREVYENQDEAKSKGLALKQNIKDNFNEEVIAKCMVQAIEEII